MTRRLPHVAILSVHPPKVAATRLRTEQYRPAIEGAGVGTTTWSFLREEDLPRWYGTSHAQRLLVLLLAVLRLPRVIAAVRGSGVVVVQREALPFGPPLVELLAARGRRLVWDVDDAIWERFESPTAGRVPTWLRATGGKYEVLCRRADQVWAGSEVLAQWCRRHSSAVALTPTVVDVPSEQPEPWPGRTVSWIGSHSTGMFLEAILPAVAAVSPPPTAYVVGARPRLPAGLDAEVRSWSPQEEERTLRQTRVGLYPIDRHHPLADGKCGLKAILFMAHGIPPVVTPTETNATVVREGIDGLYADSDTEWTAAVSRLLDDEALWAACSASAHQRALEHYSLARWAPEIARRLVTLAGGA